MLQRNNRRDRDQPESAGGAGHFELLGASRPQPQSHTGLSRTDAGGNTFRFARDSSPHAPRLPATPLRQGHLKANVIHEISATNFMLQGRNHEAFAPKADSASFRRVSRNAGCASDGRNHFIMHHETTSTSRLCRSTPGWRAPPQPDPNRQENPRGDCTPWGDDWRRCRNKRRSASRVRI